MTAPKHADIYGLLLGIEAAYGGGGVLSTATDGVLLYERARLIPQYVSPGDRPNGPGTHARPRGVVPLGRWGQITPKVLFRGPGAAPGASVFSNDLHNLMRISGHAATLTAGTRWRYTPVSQRSLFESGFLGMYADGEQWTGVGAYADMGFEIDGPGFCMFDFPISCTIPDDPTEVDPVPAITYQGHEHPQAENIALTIGAAVLVPLRARFRANRALSPRARLVAGAHAGFAMGVRDPELVVTVEREAWADYDPFGDWHGNAGAVVHRNTTLSVDGGVGAAFNRLFFQAPQARVKSVRPAEDGPVSTVEVTLACEASGPGADDDYLIDHD